jgi:hypothetical protein
VRVISLLSLSLSFGQAVATLVVDVFALHLLKSGRAVYSKYKFLPTPTYHGTPPPPHQPPPPPAAPPAAHENENRW